MKGRIMLYLLAILVQANAFGEGSRELTATGGYRAFLLSQRDANLSFPFPTLGTMKVFARSGETIAAGSSAQGFGSGSILLRAPNGATYTSGNSPTVGLISNRSQELAGPLPATGGYTPYMHMVLPAEEGVWEVDFISPSNGASIAGNPVPVLANAAWTQSAGQYIAAFDVSVRNVSNSQFIPGRAFTNIFSGILGTFDVGFNAIFRILTKDGYQYTLDNNGQAGNGFSFFANNKGFRTAAGLASYLSVDDLTNPNIQDPRTPDTESDITHKIFFNIPATDLPATAPVPGGRTTWLLSAPAAAVLSDITFTGVEGTNGAAGTFPLGANIGFTSNKNGIYLLSIDVNNNGLYTDAVDRKLAGNGTAGINQVYWDGKDGLGNKVAATSAGMLTVNVSVVLFGGEVHFPFFDVERNVRGIILTRLNGAGAPDNTLYWDDSPITVVGTPSNPVKNLAGINSTVNGHKWGVSGPEPVEFGNENGIDTWGYIAGTPLISSTSFRLSEADLQMVSLTVLQNCAGNTVTYEATVKNNGPDDVSAAVFRFTFPAVISGLVVSTRAVTGISSLAAGAAGAGSYTALLDMKNGASLTIILTGSVSPPRQGLQVVVSASVLRTRDVNDPDAVDPDPSPPVDALTECNAAPSGTGCNNIRELTSLFLAAPDAGPDQVISQNKIAVLTANGAGNWIQSGRLPAFTAIKDPAAAATQVSGFKTTGTYQFIWTNANGCSDTTLIVVVFSDDETQVPNVITPNGDGRNDFFEILGIAGFPGSQLTIFNRWGNEVYRSNDYKNNWDGSGLSEGTYYYLFNRKETTGKFATAKGWIYLKRN